MWIYMTMTHNGQPQGASLTGKAENICLVLVRCGDREASYLQDAETNRQVLPSARLRSVTSKECLVRGLLAVFTVWSTVLTLQWTVHRWFSAFMTQKHKPKLFQLLQWGIWMVLLTDCTRLKGCLLLAAANLCAVSVYYWGRHKTILNSSKPLHSLYLHIIKGDIRNF